MLAIIKLSLPLTLGSPTPRHLFYKYRSTNAKCQAQDMLFSATLSRVVVRIAVQISSCRWNQFEPWALSHKQSSLKQDTCILLQLWRMKSRVSLIQQNWNWRPVLSEALGEEFIPKTSPASRSFPHSVVPDLASLQPPLPPSHPLPAFDSPPSLLWRRLWLITLGPPE